MRRIWFIIPAIILFITADAQLRLPRLICNGMVLQRDQPIKIWGWDAPGTTITVNFKGKSFPGKVTSDGKWLIQLPAQKAGGPFIIKIKGSSEIELNDILIGDVWLASGQSNMELWMDRVKYTYAKEIARVNYPKIRQFLVPDKYHFKEPQQDFSSGEWLIANKKNIGVFSAAAFFFCCRAS